ncbi:MAG: sugar phosphate isomerase/epimerase family protein [Eubacteriales bacterium]|jgi:sugar phosphate isomerase/epimerase
MKLGCHAAMFGRERMATEPEILLREIASTGFDGFECNYRFVVGDTEQEFANMLKENGLELSALHYMANWIEDPEGAISGAVRVAEFLATQPSKNIVMSGQWADMDEKKMIEVVKNMDRAASEVAKLGVTLNYHNHHHEFVNGALPYKIMREYAPNMFFGFDIGWAYKGGYNPISLLKENRGRVQYVHIRDPRKLTDEEKVLLSRPPQPFGRMGQPDPDWMKIMYFPDLGNGDTDLKAQINFLNGYLPEGGWLIVEYEMGEPNVNRYIKAKKLIDELLLV